jgi:hypothetical protein
MIHILRRPATGYVFAALVLAVVLLVPMLRELLFTSFSVIRTDVADLPGTVYRFVTSIF